MGREAGHGAVTILATGGAGILFALLVVVSGSVLAPMGLHWAMNGPGSIAAWLVGRRQDRDRLGEPSADAAAQEPDGDDPVG